MYKILVAAPQRLQLAAVWTVRLGLFAYNELPTFAVAKEKLVQGASEFDAPFFLACSFLIQPLKCSR